MGLVELLLAVVVWVFLIGVFFETVRWAVRSALQQFLEANREELVKVVREAVAAAAERKG